MHKKTKKPIVIAAIVIGALAIFVGAMFAAIKIIQSSGRRSGEDNEKAQEAIEDGAASSLIDLDLREEKIKVTDEKTAQKALPKLKGLFSDKAVQEHTQIADVHSVGDSSYYRFNCSYDGIPIFGKSIVLVANGSEADTVTSNYRFTDNVSKADDLDDEMLAGGVDRFLKEWVAENTDEDPGYTVSSIGQIDSEQRVYYPVEQDQLELAYRIPCQFQAADGSAFSPELIVSAADGEVLDYSEPYDDLDGGKAVDAYNGDGTETVPAVIENGVYTLKDAKRNITILNADGKNHKKAKFKEYKPVTSDNSTFGDTDQEKKDHYDKAVKLMKILQNLSDFYRDRFYDELKAGLTGVYDDGYQMGGNMSSQIQTYSDQHGGIIYVGSGRNYDLLETFGHEYGHLIEQEHAGMNSSENKTREIKEATADILGVLFESVSTGKKPVWKVDEGMNERNLAKGGNQEDLFHPNDYHRRSTEFSHAAYLMYQGNGKDDTEAIKDTEILMELWYRTVLLLSGSPTYRDGRVACESAARQMVNLGSLSEKQYRCVEWAFDSIGVTSNMANVIKTPFGGKLKMRVRSADGGNAVDYTVEIRDRGGKEVFRQSYDSAGEVVVGLDPGGYLITVKDNKNIWADAHGTVAVSAGILGSMDGHLEIMTTFGTNLQGQVWNGPDDDSGKIKNAKIVLESRTITDRDGKDRSKTKTVSDKDGYYFLNIRPGTYRLTARKDGYETVEIDTVHIHPGKNNKDYEKKAHFIVMKKLSEAKDNGADSLAPYAAVIRDAEAANGQFSLENTGWCCMTHGVNYLQLIDMDKDGSDELIIGYNGSGASYAYHDMPLEVWTLRKGKAKHVGNAQVLLLGADLSEVDTTILNGHPAILGGNMFQDPEFYSWTFDGKALNKEALNYDISGMLDYVQADKNVTRCALNSDMSDQAPVEKQFEQICSVKRKVGLPVQKFPEWPQSLTE